MAKMGQDTMSGVVIGERAAEILQDGTACSGQALTR
jgi:hypothetical protein